MNLWSVTFYTSQWNFATASGAHWKQYNTSYWCEGRQLTRVPPPWPASVELNSCQSQSGVEKNH